MKKPRSLDPDGLDGVLSTEGGVQHGPKPKAGSALIAAAAMALIILLAVLTFNPDESPQQTPHAVAVESASKPTPPLPSEQTPVTVAAPSGAPPAGASSAPPDIDPEDRRLQDTASVTPVVGGESESTNPTPAVDDAVNHAPAPLFTVYFELKSSQPKALTDADKDRLLAGAKSCNQRLLLAGHTCNLGGAKSNQRLGLARANAVKTWLIQRGVDGNAIETVSHGMDQPVASNATPAGQASNRRVELLCPSR